MKNLLLRNNTGIRIMHVPGHNIWRCFMLSYFYISHLHAHLFTFRFITPLPSLWWSFVGGVCFIFIFYFTRTGALLHAPLVCFVCLCASVCLSVSLFSPTPLYVQMDQKPADGVHCPGQQEHGVGHRRGRHGVVPDRGHQGEAHGRWPEVVAGQFDLPLTQPLCVVLVWLYSTQMYVHKSKLIHWILDEICDYEKGQGWQSSQVLPLSTCNINWYDLLLKRVKRNCTQKNR